MLSKPLIPGTNSNTKRSVSIGSSLSVYGVLITIGLLALLTLAVVQPRSIFNLWMLIAILSGLADAGEYSPHSFLGGPWGFYDPIGILAIHILSYHLLACASVVAFDQFLTRDTRSRSLWVRIGFAIPIATLVMFIIGGLLDYLLPSPSTGGAGF